MLAKYVGDSLCISNVKGSVTCGGVQCYLVHFSELEVYINMTSTLILVKNSHFFTFIRRIFPEIFMCFANYNSGIL
jgi:hypothetical protein